MRDLEKSCARNRKSYMKDPKKSRADSGAQSCEIIAVVYFLESPAVQAMHTLIQYYCWTIL